ncbi:site-specific integrase [Arenicella sp. 4NH20-0111]
MEHDSRVGKEKHTIFWESGDLWVEVHDYLRGKRVKAATIRSNAYDLYNYAEWLESENIHWLHFPLQKKNRCLYRYRGYLTRGIKGTGKLEARRMNAVINFYRWCKVYGVIDKQLQLWSDQQVPVSFFNDTGFERTSRVLTTDLKIQSRNKNITSVESGLLPISIEDRDELLKFLLENQSERNQVLYLLFLTGFYTGARLGSIRKLRIEHLEAAIEDPVYESILQVQAGPGTGIPTKFDVSGCLRFPRPIADELKKYARTNVARLLRQTKASEKNRSLIFLTKNGKPYSQQNINMAMSELRSDLVLAGLTQFCDLKFHQSRATCGTELARILMRSGEVNAIQLVRDWLMHKSETVTMKYINFIKVTRQAEKLNSEYNKRFLGEDFGL